MSGTPQFKVYDADGKYQAACKELEAAACVVSMYGEGATIRSDHAKARTLWTEGKDGDASESWDACATHCARVRREKNIAQVKRTYGKDAPEMLVKLGLS